MHKPKFFYAAPFKASATGTPLVHFYELKAGDAVAAFEEVDRSWPRARGEIVQTIPRPETQLVPIELVGEDDLKYGK